MNLTCILLSENVLKYRLKHAEFRNEIKKGGHHTSFWAMIFLILFISYKFFFFHKAI